MYAYWKTIDSFPIDYNILLAIDSFPSLPFLSVQTYLRVLYTPHLVDYALFYSNTKTFFVFLFFYARAAL